MLRSYSRLFTPVTQPSVPLSLQPTELLTTTVFSDPPNLLVAAVAALALHLWSHSLVHPHHLLYK